MLEIAMEIKFILHNKTRNFYYVIIRSFANFKEERKL